MAGTKKHTDVINLIRSERLEGVEILDNGSESLVKCIINERRIVQVSFNLSLTLIPPGVS